MSLFLSATLPLIIYFAIDHYFEFHIAIILTIIYGLLEFTFFYIKDKRIDKLVLIATILVVLMGGISYIFDNESFFKLKPAIMQLFAVGFLGYFIITKKSIFEIMKDRLPQNMREIDPEKENLMNRMTKHLAIVLLLHTFLIAYSAYYMSTASWTFISAVLPYILMFGIMFFEVFLMRRKAIKEFKSQQNQNIKFKNYPKETVDYKKGSIRKRKNSLND